LKNVVFLTLISALSLAGCSSSKAPQNEFSKFGFTDAIYSTRPTTNNPSISLLKLKTPALLETAERKDGKIVVDPDLLKAIQAEQAATIDALTKISPEIKVLIRYKLVLNGLAIYAPPQFEDQIRSLPNVTLSEKAASFGRPQSVDEPRKGIVGVNTSVNFIGAEAAYAQNIHGEGLRIGVIDTGIDYTHKLLLGEGTEAAYKAINPAVANAAFPNKKVVGGIDLVGTEFNPASPDFTKHVPVPDMNPLDEAGHGTHVAGTIAGIGDGINTYSGVAPAAELYAIKVFGAKGGTSDEVVIAAMEYAADPTGDLSFSQQLDVVNLSLGSDYGNPHLMYSHAVKNLVRGGTVVVASAGNSGDKSYVVGSPSITDDAISVAASVDNMLQNTQFPAAVFKAGTEIIKAEMLEGSTTKTIASFPQMSGEVIALGVADADFDAKAAALINGKVALIDRGGKVTFSLKIERAQKAGAIAVIIVNNVDGDPEGIGGEGKFKIPAVMITKAAGTSVKEKLATSVVTVDLKTSEKIDKPELVDTMAGFSSRGPRSEDGLIKPEISSPGSNIISAEMGKGQQGVTMSGTSMAGPHITGVMALLKQKFNTANPAELKSILLAHGKLIADKDKKQYSVSRQGAGRVQIAESLEAKIVTIPATLSFGITDLEKQKTLSQEITVKNIGKDAVTLKAVWNGSAALQFVVPSLSLAAGESKKITVTVKVSAGSMKAANDELDGYLSFATEKETLAQLPALVVARQISQIMASAVKVHATSLADSAGSTADVVIKNNGVNVGTAHLFNLLGTDGRKIDRTPDYAHNRNCDVQSAGYRIIEKNDEKVLQVAVKLYERMTTWNTCELNVQIDSNGDGLADQEIAGVLQSSLPGLTGDKFVSLLLDGNKARDIRKKYEVDLTKPKEQLPKDPNADPTDPPKFKEINEDYVPALLDMREMKTFDGSSLAIIEADISKLTLAETGELNIKVSTTHQDSGVIEYDDYLGKEDEQWDKISVNPMAQSFNGLPETVELKGSESKTVSVQKGYGTGALIMYAPQNRSVVDVLLEDSQSIVVPVGFGD
jgi:minor extracellular serine protease Vpr